MRGTVLGATLGLRAELADSRLAVEKIKPTPGCSSVVTGGSPGLGRAQSSHTCGKPWMEGGALPPPPASSQNGLCDPGQGHSLSEPQFPDAETQDADSRDSHPRPPCSLGPIVSQVHRCYLEPQL